MTKKYQQAFGGAYTDLKNDFTEEDYVLNYKPVIEYVAPEGIEEEVVFATAPPTIDDLKNRTEKAIAGYKAVRDLAEAAQERIDNKISAAGGLDIHLDPIKDALVIGAIKRKFPDAKDPNVITYDQYRDCLDAMRRNQIEKSQSVFPTDTDYQAARSDPFKTNFGGLGNLPGMNRAEIASPAQIVEPINIDEFQSNMIIALFEKMVPMISKLILKLINPF